MNALRTKLQDPLDEISAVLSIVTDTAVSCAGYQIADRELEDQVKKLLDVSQALRTGLATVPSLAHEHGSGAFVQCVEDARRSHEAKSDLERYGNVSEFQDYKRKVFKERNPDKPVPSVAAWFTVQAEEESESEHDGIAMTANRNLRCPLTQQIMVHPMVSLVCVHAYEQEAILHSVRVGGGSITCPISGCPARLDRSTLALNKTLARECRKAREELEERRGPRESGGFTRIE